MLVCFEDGVTFAETPGWGRKTSGMERAEEITTEIVEGATTNIHGISNTSWYLDILYKTIWRLLRNVLKFYQYKEK